MVVVIIIITIIMLMMMLKKYDLIHGVLFHIITSIIPPMPILGNHGVDH